MATKQLAFPHYPCGPSYIPSFMDFYCNKPNHVDTHLVWGAFFGGLLHRICGFEFHESISTCMDACSEAEVKLV